VSSIVAADDFNTCVSFVSKYVLISFGTTVFVARLRPSEEISKELNPDQIEICSFTARANNSHKLYSYKAL
jgi:hypothetical protein